MSTNPETLRKRISKNNETSNQKQARLARESERKRQRRENETDEQREARLEDVRERRRRKESTESIEEREQRINHESRRRRNSRANRREIERASSTHQETEPEPEEIEPEEVEPEEEEPEEAESEEEEPEEEPETQDTQEDIYSRLSATTINEDELHMLKNFRNKMDNIYYKLCNVCNERIPSLTLIREMCRRCYNEKNTPKKFSAENNMDPGEVPEELKTLTEIEEMLIAQVFTVIMVYRLRGGQNGYRGNVINFHQDIQEFTNRLPRSPSSLDILVVRRESANDPSAFRDFTVRRGKVGRALIWLKENNPYYRDIIIDDEIL
jgi:hypothetical protein